MAQELNNGTEMVVTKESTEKSGFQKALDTAQKGWIRFSNSKGGRWAIRIGKGALIAFGMKTAYDAGKKSVQPTIVMVHPVEDEEAPAEETQEETAVEAATNE